jgi:hypothetical protein
LRGDRETAVLWWKRLCAVCDGAPSAPGGRIKSPKNAPALAGSCSPSASTTPGTVFQP